MLTQIFVTSDMLTQIFVSSDMLIQIFVSSDMLTQIFVTSDMLIQILWEADRPSCQDGSASITGRAGGHIGQDDDDDDDDDDGGGGDDDDDDDADNDDDNGGDEAVWEKYECVRRWNPYDDGDSDGKYNVNGDNINDFGDEVSSGR